MFPGQPAQAQGHLAGQVEGAGGAGSGAQLRAGPVGGQFQRLQTGQLPLPVGQVRGLGGAVPAGPLPGGDVGVLEPRLGQAAGFAGQPGAVERRQVVEEHAHGPAVGDDVVRADHQDVDLGRLADQERPERRGPAQVEGDLDLGQQQRVEAFAHGAVAVRQADDPQRQRAGLGGPLHGLGAVGGEGGAQHLVAGGQVGEGGAEGSGVQRAGQAQGGGAVVLGAALAEFAQHPQAALGGGDGQR
ncbi:hypothetical protein EES44_01815 [Streptomyces sp. ADI96-15]|nr:hypothetical protein EES44_01815 [Streptomyces sp. ADI96-15]